MDTKKTIFQSEEKFDKEQQIPSDVGDDFKQKIEEFKKLGSKIKRKKNTDNQKTKKEKTYKELVNEAYKRLKTKENEKFLKLLFDFLKDPNSKNFIILGDRGIGKSYLLENLLIHGKKYWLDAFYIEEADFYDKFASGELKRRGINEKTCDIRDYIYEIMLKTKILILDDIGTVVINEKFYPKYKFLLDYRLRRGLKTIFISNLKVGDLEKLFDDRLQDRIFENHILVHITTWTNKRHGGKINLVEL